MKRTLWRVTKWLLGCGVLTALVWLNWDKLQEMLAHWDRFDPSQLLISGVVFLAGVFLTFFRWFLLVRAQELPFRPADAVRLGFISLFFSAFLPGSVGGDLVKAGLLAREQSRRTVAISTIVLDRVIGLVGLIFLASLAGLALWDEANSVVDSQGNKPLRWIVLFVWGLSGVVLLAGLIFALWPMNAEAWHRFLSRIPLIGRILAELLTAARMYRHKLRVVMVVIGLAMIGHIGFVMSFYFASQAVPAPIPSLEEQWLLVPVGMVVEAVPLTPGGNIGVGEATYDILYNLVDPGDGRYKGKGAMARVAQRLVYWAIALVGLAFYLPLRGTVRQIMAEEEEDKGTR